MRARMAIDAIHFERLLTRLHFLAASTSTRTRLKARAMSIPSMRIMQSLVVYAKDKERVSAFYRRTLGVDAVDEAPTHDLLRGPGIEIVIHAIPDRYAASIEIDEPPALREETALKPVFLVSSLDDVRAAAMATGGGLKPATAAWRYNDATVLDGNDPEGNVVQFRQYDA